MIIMFIAVENCDNQQVIICMLYIYYLGVIEIGLVKGAFNLWITVKRGCFGVTG
ncbi:protein of unknown function [Shewanella benthica]|uniref:Uncharacterized protein n=1 Tax=Shewanella benthica TaxID=43661 RepID=A0A330M2T9_9GAMM|nr:protein of unknown function [Shewanella benthica]